MYEIWSLGYKPFDDYSTKEVYNSLIITNILSRVIVQIVILLIATYFAYKL